MNNLSARLKINKWLLENGHEPIPINELYTVFATRLRKIVAPKQVQIDFVSRPDACAYIRHIANKI